MAHALCRICLHTEFESSIEIHDALVRFHLELCEYDVCEVPPLEFCRTCKDQLEGLFRFRQKCRDANQILLNWSQGSDQKTLEELHKLIPKTVGNLYLKNDLGPLDVTIKIEKNENPLVPDLINNFQKHCEKNDFEINVQIEDYNDMKSENYLEPDSDADIKIKKKKKKKTTLRKRKLKYESDSDDEVKVKKVDSKKLNKSHIKIKDRIVELIENGEFHDIQENITITKDLFLKMFEKCDKAKLKTITLLKQGSAEERKKLKKFLLQLIKKNNPEYETVFDIDHLDTEAKRRAEFSQRRLSKHYVEAAIKCELCYKVFEVQSLLDYHNRWHQPSTGPHECDMCRMRFASRKALAQHLKTNHHSVYRCKICPLLTYNPAVMVNHYNQHKGMEYSCPVCLSVFSNKNTLNNHRRQAHKTSHICPLCARSFVSEKGLYFHKRLKHKDEGAKSCHGVTCDQCHVTLDSAEVLDKHVKQMHGSGQAIFKCFHCKEIFDSLDELKSHKIALDHQRPPKTPTPRDNKKTTRTPETNICRSCKHLFRGGNNLHKCGFCQAKFTSAEALSSHRTSAGHQKKVRYEKKPRVPRTGTRLRCNDPDKPMEKCQLCPEMVSTLRTTCMYQHFLTAHPDVPYASVYIQPHNKHLCDQCGKTFKDLTFFKDHANLHSGLRPYACIACARAFATRRHLRLHAERHAPPRHACARCGKRFNSAANLFAHRRGHVGDRRFKCEICSKGFLHAAALAEHVRGVHHHIRRARKHRDK